MQEKEGITKKISRLYQTHGWLIFHCALTAGVFIFFTLVPIKTIFGPKPIDSNDLPRLPDLTFYMNSFFMVIPSLLLFFGEPWAVIQKNKGPQKDYPFFITVIFSFFHLIPSFFLVLFILLPFIYMFLFGAWHLSFLITIGIVILKEGIVLYKIKKARLVPDPPPLVKSFIADVIILIFAIFLICIFWMLLIFGKVVPAGLILWSGEFFLTILVITGLYLFIYVSMCFQWVIKAFNSFISPKLVVLYIMLLAVQIYSVLSILITIK